MPKMTMEEAQKMVGKKTPLPKGKGAGALNDLPTKNGNTPTTSALKISGDPLNLKKSLRDREKAAGLKCGGPVKKYAKGGMVRGTGCATKGKKFKGVM